VSGWAWLGIALAGGGAWALRFRRTGASSGLVYKNPDPHGPYKAPLVTIGDSDAATPGIARPVVPRSPEAVPGFTPGTRPTNVSDVAGDGPGAATTVQQTDTGDDAIDPNAQALIDTMNSAASNARAYVAAGSNPDDSPAGMIYGQ